MSYYKLKFHRSVELYQSQLTRGEIVANGRYRDNPLAWLVAYLSIILQTFNGFELYMGMSLIYYKIIGELYREC